MNGSDVHAEPDAMGPGVLQDVSVAALLVG
jgi:hypothetical protein